MRNVCFSFLAIFVFASCGSKKEKQDPEKKITNNEYTISKDGIGDLKIGMSQPEVEKMVNQSFTFSSDKDAPNYWQDTVKAKYRDIEVSLYFMREYVSEDSGFMKLSGVETKSSLCKTATGIGVGDEKSSILPDYENNPISMGPEWEQVNDSTWSMSKTKYSVNIRDDKYDRELIFHLVNKKITSLEANIIMGD